MDMILELPTTRLSKAIKAAKATKVTQNKKKKKLLQINSKMAYLYHQDIPKRSFKIK